MTHGPLRGPRAVALAATLGTVAALSRIPFAAIPNVQPASAIIILAGAALGWRIGGMTGLVVPLISNAFLGHGPWTPFQMLGWGLMGAIAGLLSNRSSKGTLAVYGAIAGLGYGVLMDAWVWLASIRPLAWHTLVPVLARGVPFNLAHAGGNAVILWIVGPRLLRLLERAEAKRRVEPLEPAVDDAEVPDQTPAPAVAEGTEARTPCGSRP